jgi:hypothetical protein
MNIVAMPSFSEFYAWKTQLPLYSLPDFNAKGNFEARCEGIRWECR